MRIVILSLALVTTLSCLAGAKIEWNATSHDFGAFNESAGKVTARFTLRNTGDKTLVVTGARANCGCTTPVLSADIVEPGDSATLTVSYDPEGRPGRFEKKIYVDTNADPKRSTLTISGVSIGSSATLDARFPVEVGSLRLAHPAALLGKIKRGHVKSVFESGYNVSLDTIYPVITDVPKWLEAKVLPAAVAPGEQVSLHFFVTSGKCDQWDVVTDSVTIIADDAANAKSIYRMPVSVIVEEDFSKLNDKQLAESGAVSLDRSRLEPVVMTADGARVTFDISNSGKSPLKIRRIYIPGVETKCSLKPDQSIKPGKRLTVTLEISPTLPMNERIVSLPVTVITNDPFTPKTTLTLPVVKGNS